MATNKTQERISQYFCLHPLFEVQRSLPKLLDAAKVFWLNGAYRDAYSCLCQAFDNGDQYTTYPIIRDMRNEMIGKVRSGDPNSKEMMDIIKKLYGVTSPAVFEDFIVFTEWDRPREQKFYQSRARGLRPLVRAMQKLADDELDLLCISCPPGIGKTGLATFFITWMAGRHPELSTIVGSHSQSFLKGVYEECLREMDKEGDYHWGRAFPGHSVVKTNAADLKIDVDKARRFSTLQFGSIGSEMAGKIRATNLLYLDDLIGRLDEALNPDTLEKIWQSYTTDYRQRKQGHCKELHIATRWATRDVIGRLKESYDGDPRACFLEFPALNENDESNFDYGGENGFTTAFYHNLREDMDRASWDALYMAKPIDRNALLYEDELLRKYYDLPEGDPDAILAVCDTAEGKGDFTVLPVFAVYGNDHYLMDVVCSDALPEITDELCAEILVKYRVQQCQFESNAAGGRTADKIEELVSAKVSAKGGRKTQILKKRTLANKETKIVVNSSWVKSHCLFLDDKKIQKGTAYFSFMKQMRSYATGVKNKHDDVPDVLAQYALFTDNLIGTVATVIRRPF